MQMYKFNPHTLEYVAAKDKTRLTTLALCAVVFLIMGFSSGVKVNTVLEKVPVVLKATPEECNDANVKAYIQKLHLKFPEIVYQQAVLESQHFNSPVFKQLNNLLCMENAKTRPTTGVDVGTRFAKYNSWQESLVDYALWQACYAQNINSEEEYYYLLDKLYCNSSLAENAGPSYSSRLKQIK